MQPMISSDGMILCTSLQSTLLNISKKKLNNIVEQLTLLISVSILPESTYHKHHRKSSKMPKGEMTILTDLTCLFQMNLSKE